MVWKVKGNSGVIQRVTAREQRPPLGLGEQRQVECYTGGQFKNQWYLVAILSTENTRVFVVWTILQLSNKDKGGGALVKILGGK